MRNNQGAPLAFKGGEHLLACHFDGSAFDERITHDVSTVCGAAKHRGKMTARIARINVVVCGGVVGVLRRTPRLIGGVASEDDGISVGEGLIKLIQLSLGGLVARKPSDGGSVGF